MDEATRQLADQRAEAVAQQLVEEGGVIDQLLGQAKLPDPEAKRYARLAVMLHVAQHFLSPQVCKALGWLVHFLTDSGLPSEVTDAMYADPEVLDAIGDEVGSCWLLWRLEPIGHGKLEQDHATYWEREHSRRAG